MADVSVTFGAKDVGLKATMKALSDELSALSAKTKSTQMGFVELKTTLGRMNEIKRVQNDLRGLGDEATKAATKSKGVGSALEGMRGISAAIGLGALASGMKQLLGEFGRVQDLSERFGTTAESIQRVGNAARLGGADIETVASALTKAGLAAGKVIGGNEQMAETFNRAGINAREFLAADMDKKLLLISEAFSKTNGDALKVNAIIEILGTKGGANLIPLIQNTDELRKNMQEAAVATDETVQRLAKADDTLGNFANNLKVYSAEFLSFFAEQSERIGSLLAGQGLKTIKEMDRLQQEIEARRRLAERGVEVGDPRPQMGRLESEGLAGEQKMQEAIKARRLLNEEIARMQAEHAQAEKQRQKELQSQKENAYKAEETALKEQEVLRQKKLDDEQRITGEKQRQAELEERIAREQRESAARVAAETAEQESRALSKVLNLELEIAQAKADGNDAALKELETQKKSLEVRKRFNELVDKFTKSGETLSGATQKASQMLRAEEKIAAGQQEVVMGGGGGGGGRGGGGAMRGPEPNLGTQMREFAQDALKQQRLLGGRGEQFQEAMGAGRFGAAAQIAKGIERKANEQQRREDISKLGGALEKQLKSNIGVFGARTAAEKGLGSKTAGEFSKMSAADQARELGIKTTGKSMADLRREIDSTVDGIKKTNEGMKESQAQLEAAKKAGGDGAGDGATPQADPITKILEEVTKIKEFIDKKLPMQALAQ